MSRLQLITPSSAKATLNFAEEEVRAMQRAVIRLFERWGLTEQQSSVLLGGITTRTYQRWKRGEFGRVGVDQQERLSNLMGIHKALRLLFKEPDRGYGWIKRANEAFGGASALDVMLNGRLTDLMRVRRYLDASRG